MEILIDIITFLFLLGLIICPILLFKRINKTEIRFKFITYLVFGLVLGAIIVYVFSWWSYTSDLMLLEHYGYNIDGMNEEFYENVLPKNMDKVNNLVTSIMGIGWQLKAIITFVFYSPYLLIVYGVMYYQAKSKKKQSNAHN